MEQKSFNESFYTIDINGSIIDKKDKVRKYDSDIEARSLRLIALYQPMAIDLRRLATILKTITYLTRIG